MIAKACPEFSLDKSTTLVAISGSGNVAQYTALKVIELGATVLTLSDSKGSLVAEKGYTPEVIAKIAALKLKGGSLDVLANEPGYTYHAGASSRFASVREYQSLTVYHHRQASLDSRPHHPHRPPRCYPERGFR